MVFLDVVAFQDPGWLKNPPDRLAHHIGRPPEAADEHDRPGDRDQQAASGALNNEAEHNHGDHGPLVRLARRSIVEGRRGAGS